MRTAFAESKFPFYQDHLRLSLSFLYFPVVIHRFLRYCWVWLENIRVFIYTKLETLVTPQAWALKLMLTYHKEPMHYLNHLHRRQADASTSHASPSSLRLYTWGTSTLYTFPSWCFLSKNLFQTQDENQAKKNSQGIILRESNGTIFDIWIIENVEANNGVIIIRTLEFDVIHTTIVFR